MIRYSVLFANIFVMVDAVYDKQLSNFVLNLNDSSVLQLRGHRIHQLNLLLSVFMYLFNKFGYLNLSFTIMIYLIFMEESLLYCNILILTYTNDFFLIDNYAIVKWLGRILYFKSFKCIQCDKDMVI